jgi:hypothetical protein
VGTELVRLSLMLSADMRVVRDIVNIESRLTVKMLPANAGAGVQHSLYTMVSYLAASHYPEYQQSPCQGKLSGWLAMCAEVSIYCTNDVVLRNFSKALYS